MNKKPFRKLKSPRYVERHNLPEPLADFYELHEGNGLECDSISNIRLCRLVDLELRTSSEVRMLKGIDSSSDWNRFEGWFVGISMYLDEIHLVEHAPCCDPGSILVIGPDVAGPGGTGAQQIESSLVLATSISAWLERLGQCNWTELGLSPGSIADLPKARQAEVRSYYEAMNPGIVWGRSQET